jgi:RNA polymerase subunit RPABC4/transcription elongation factor Spt4
MAFCANCGKEMGDGVKFCPSCGTQAGGPAPAKPATEKLGTIRTCPACGSEVPAMTALCPFCGHEFSNTQASSLITAFAEQISALDYEIAGEWSKYNNSAKSSIKKVLWIVLNVFTYGIPFIISMLRKVFAPKIPPMMPSEHKKKSLIENFVVPNTREDIMEFVMFSATKIQAQIEAAGTSLVEMTIANKWARIWSDKCKQLSARAGLVLADDTKTMSAINSLMEKPHQILAAAKRKTLIKQCLPTAVLILVTLGFVVDCSGILIKVPDAATVAAENVTLNGSFAGKLKASGSGVLMRSIDGGADIQISLELETAENLNTFVEQSFARRKKEYGWDKDNCTYELSIDIIISGLSVGYFAERAILSSLLKLTPGTPQKISLPIALGSSPGSRKKEFAKLMSQQTLEMSLSVRYQITNQTRKDAKMDDYYHYVDL